jgi:hypothetical protein
MKEVRCRFSEDARKTTKVNQIYLDREAVSDHDTTNLPSHAS